ncbi:DUF2946 family protein [Cardiobacterium sp. AH-315-I02]|nr:DUF2946 family protein [Cardiobacterium sp. AH-315-I02]
MKIGLNQNSKKRVVMLLGTLAFILHSFSPFIFQTASANTADGYMVTICTTYGQKTIFVDFNKNKQQQEQPHCLECPHCIIQASVNSWMASTIFSLDPQIQPLYKNLTVTTSSLPKTPLPRHFLSRAPPA